jgi:hypothetical protein
MSAADSDSLAIWKSVSIWGMILVWLGVFIEGAEVYVLLRALWKRRRLRVIWAKLPDPPQHWKVDLVGAIGWAILVVGLVLEIDGHIHEQRLTEAENKRLTEQLDSTTTLAAKLNKEAADERLIADKLEVKYEELRAQNDLLEKRSLPRSIWFDLGTLPKDLGGFAKTKLLIQSAVGDDSPSVASQIENIAKSAGWDVAVEKTTEPLPDGVSIGLNSAQDLRMNDWWVKEWSLGGEKSPLHKACVALFNELRSGGLTIKLDEDMYSKWGSRFDGVVILVGARFSVLDEQIVLLENENRDLKTKEEAIRKKEAPYFDSMTNGPNAFSAALQELLKEDEVLNEQIRSNQMNSFRLDRKKSDANPPPGWNKLK